MYRERRDQSLTGPIDVLNGVEREREVDWRKLVHNRVVG